MEMIGKLPEPLKIDIHKVEEHRFRRRTQSSEEGEGGVEFSMTSVLNQRPQGVHVDGLSESKLNLRYTKRKAASSPPMANGHLIANGFVNGDIHPIAEDSDDLARTKINHRYIDGVNGEDMSQTKLNQRYLRMAKVKGKHGVAEKIARKNNRDVTLERLAASSDNMSVGTGHSDWSHWVEDVFSNALNEHVDGLSDVRSVENRLKGGGKGKGGMPVGQTQVSNYQNIQRPWIIWGNRTRLQVLFLCGKI